ncbi:PGF-CTERM sorting domain-containing protein [Salinigranum sp. GCM10025319]|uniref:PGF-CTERM sorting domain-containing protein n=1 Tax=Salinigranum sp. GCM10025319 TaxID=3252687 RepID=UPI00360CA591
MSPSRTLRTVTAALVLVLLVQSAATPVVATTGDDEATPRATHGVAPLTTESSPTEPSLLLSPALPASLRGSDRATVTGESERRALGASRLGRDDGFASHRPDGEPTIATTYVFEHGERPGVVRLHIQYDLPDSVTVFDVSLPDLAGSSVSIADTEGFDRRDETTVEWTRATRTPVIDLRLAVSTESITAGGWGVERDEWAFATTPETRISTTYRGPRPRLNSTTTVDGPGYGADHMAVLGSHDVTNVSIADEDVAFVVADGSNATAANLTSARTFLDRAAGRFDFGVRRDRLVVFVLPEEDRGPGSDGTFVTGESFGDAFWVTAEATTIDGVENAFAHEYVHSRLGGVGGGSAAWLTEATAEYYGYLSMLNLGRASYDDFHDAATAEHFAPDRTAVTLADRETWRGNLGEYEKGAHVLAALDAEIRERTDGETTLYDVLVANHEFTDYAAFRAHVVETTGEESLGPWLDRYVTTDALPPVPDDPGLYVHGPELDPDGDGLTSRAELAGDPETNPFVADTDGDGLNDAREREIGTDPTRADTDGDTLSDAREVDAGTDPTRADTDGDGANDAIDAYPTDPSVRTVQSAEPTSERPPTPTVEPSLETESTTSEPEDTGTATPVPRDESTEEGVDEGVGSRVDTPGFGVGVALAALTLGGMLFRRQN